MDGQIRIVGRHTMPFIREVEQGGTVHVLGELRDFRWSDVLRAFMPDSSEFAVSWVQLLHGETLAAHTHPIQTMMVIYRGSGAMFGDLRRPIARDDVIVVPPGCEHGFVGGPDGLYALSIQFGSGFYTDPKRARVMFVDKDAVPGLLAYSDRRSSEFVRHSLFGALHDGTLEDPTRREAYLRRVTTWLERTRRLADGERGLGDSDDDPVARALVHWFSYQLRVADSVERMSLVALVLERALALYVERATAVLGGHLGQGTLAARHPGSTRAQMDLLEEQPAHTLHRVRTLVGQAWDVVTATADRIVELVRGE